MDIQYFVEKFAEQFDETDIGCFSPKTVFKELDEWSSLIALTLIAMIDEEYDVTMTGEDIRDATTIEDLFTIIGKSKK